LHVTVLNTVVHHLDVVTSTIITDPFTARLTIALGSNVLEDVLDEWPGLLVSTGHQRRTVSGTFLTTGNTGTDESDTLASQVFCSAVGIGEMRVAAINDDVAFLTVGEECLDEVVDWLTSHDEEHHTAGLLQLTNELFNRVGAFDRFSLCLVCQEVVNFGDGSVEGNDIVSVVSRVQDQVLAHDGQANEAEISPGSIVSI